jgi:hypothetical protein
MENEPEADALLLMLRELLLTLLGKNATDEEIIRFWFYLGQTIGISNIFPYMKVVVTPPTDDMEETSNAVVGLVASPSEALVEVLSSTRVFTERVMDIVLEDYKTQRSKP